MMMKLLLRFLLICLIGTVIISFVVFEAYQYLENKNTYKTIVSNTEGKYYSIYQYLKPYPVTEWQTKLNEVQPADSSVITISSIDKLPLTATQIKKIKQGQLVYTISQIDKWHPTITYKKIPNSDYAFVEQLDFSVAEKAQRFFGWAPIMIIQHLNTIPESDWDGYLKMLSTHYHFPISIKKINSLSPNVITELKTAKWYVSNLSSESNSELLYYRINSDKALQFGPTYYSYSDKYEQFFLFFIGLLLVEMFIFIFAFLFLRSLEKLITLANQYSAGKFNSSIKINKNSSLYTLFTSLKNMGQKIKNLLKAREDLSNAVSHELRTPLSRLEFSLEILGSSTDKKTLKSRVESMKEDISELDDLISELLIYSKLKTADYIDLKPINLHELITQLIDKYHTQISINYVNNYPNLTILADAKQLTRALHNILINAKRFAKSTILISLLPISSNNYSISIEDDGSGVAAEDRQKIFEPFVQLNKGHGRNVGLGLAITKKIIELHGWRITVNDSSLGGAKFEIVLLN